MDYLLIIGILLKKIVYNTNIQNQIKTHVSCSHNDTHISP
jgi:hypothetical protein